MSALDALRSAIAAAAPATAPALDPDRYPGLKITRAPAAGDPALQGLLGAAFAEAGWPEDGIPTPAELTDAQRALAEVVASAPGLPLHRWAIPQTAWARRRWLGLEPAGVIAREVDYTVDGGARRGPLWRALAALDQAGEEDQALALLAALPAAERLEAYGDLALDAWRFTPPQPAWDDLGDAGRAWAPAFADRLVALFAPDTPHGERGDHTEPPADLVTLVIRALVAAGVPIEPRWDGLVPLELDLIDALPPARRGPVVARGLAAQFPASAIRTGLELVAKLPSREVVDHLLERSEQCLGSLSCPPRRTVLARLREAIAGEAALVAVVDAKLAALPPPVILRCTRAVYPRSVDELTAGQRTQLAILGRGWDSEEDGVPMVRDGDDGHPVFGSLEYVSAFEIADAEGRPAFEALLYMDEDGAVCRAGTTQSVAYVSQMRLSWNIDEPTVEALHAILRQRPPRSS
ncbi:MAG TPA: hypothetical protein VM734_20130 [Kofleriaceae bacterium]|nr:hypothetical protein [Kofleriaceae bacterium]